MESACGAIESELQACTGAGQDEVSRQLRLVYHVAHALVRGRGILIELDELVSAGTLGLIEALSNYDASRGIAFTTFAAPRIRGAMLDELRRLDHVPRSVRRRARAVATATDALAGELGAAPNAKQLAERLGVDRDTLWRWQSDSSAAESLPLDADDDGTSREEYLERSSGDIDEALMLEQELVELRGAIRALSSRERTVLTLYFYEELRLHQIAEVLGVTESRVSQIRTQAIARLRDQLARLRSDLTQRCRLPSVAPR